MIYWLHIKHSLVSYLSSVQILRYINFVKNSSTIKIRTYCTYTRTHYKQDILISETLTSPRFLACPAYVACVCARQEYTELSWYDRALAGNLAWAPRLTCSVSVMGDTHPIWYNHKLHKVWWYNKNKSIHFVCNNICVLSHPYTNKCAQHSRISYLGRGKGGSETWGWLGESLRDS